MGRPRAGGWAAAFLVGALVVGWGMAPAGGASPDHAGGEGPPAVGEERRGEGAGHRSPQAEERAANATTTATTTTTTTTTMTTVMLSTTVPPLEPPTIATESPAAAPVAAAASSGGVSMAATGTIKATLVTWHVIGLDSNDVNAGPNVFPVTVRACNRTDGALTDATATFVWDTANALLALEGSATLGVPALAVDACVDLTWNVVVTRDPAAYDTTRRFHVTVTGGGLTASTPMRELYVERLNSQNRNSVLSITGPTQVYVGETVTYVVESETAPGGYEQLVAYLTLSGTIFVLESVQVTYGAPPGATNDRVYADACGWDADFASPTYRTCIGPEQFAGGKAGGRVTSRYTVRIVGPGTADLTSAIYDMSGSSYHYNTDYGTGANLLRVTALPSADLSLSKGVVGVLVAGQVATYELTVENTGPSPADAPVTITDTLPAGLTFMSSATPGWSCTSADGTHVTCAGGSAIAVGASTSVQLTVSVASTAGPSITNVGVVSSPTHDPDPADNTATHTGIVAAPLVPLLAASAPPAAPRGPVGAELPRTGSGALALFRLALALVVVGGLTVLMARRPSGVCRRP